MTRYLKWGSYLHHEFSRPFEEEKEEEQLHDEDNELSFDNFAQWGIT